MSVYFEEQNIDTMSEDGEFMLTILASFAQEESRSVSENCKWRVRKKFEQGIPTGFGMYGYSKMASLPIKCNQLGCDYAEQNTNNAIGMANSELLIDKHWIAYSGCCGNDDAPKHGEHEFSDWILDESIGLLCHECEICC